MQINVNCGCGCNCGCHGGGGQNVGVNDDGTPINGPIPPVPSDQEPSEFVGAWQCDAANEYVDVWIDFYNNVFSAGTIGTATFLALAPFFIAATILTGGAVAIIALVLALTVTPGAHVVGWVNGWLDENRQGLICAMANALTPAQAYQNVMAYLEIHKGDQNGSFAGEWIQRILSPAFQDTDWNALFAPDSIEIRLANQESVCNCQGTIELPEFDGWYFLPAVEGEEFVNTNSSYQVTNYVWNFVGSGAGQESQSVADFAEFLAAGRTWLDAGFVGATPEHAGYVLQKISGAVDISTFNISGTGIFGLESADWIAADVWSQWHTASDLPKLDFQAAIESQFSGLTIVHAGDRTFTNADQHRMTMVGDDDTARSVQFRLWAVVAASALTLT